MINLGGDASTLQVEGEEHVRVYRAELERDGKKVRSAHQRHFCGECGCHLWAFNERWPEFVHPVASAIDTSLPRPPARVHMMEGSKAPWVDVDALSQPQDEHFEAYPARSLARFHRDHGYEDSP